MIIFKSTLTTFEESFIFWGSWGSIKNWLELKIEPALADLACLNPWNTLYNNRHPLYKINLSGVNFINPMAQGANAPEFGANSRKKSHKSCCSISINRQNCDQSSPNFYFVCSMQCQSEQFKSTGAKAFCIMLKKLTLGVNPKCLS